MDTIYPGAAIELDKYSRGKQNNVNGAVVGNRHQPAKAPLRSKVWYYFASKLFPLAEVALQ